MVVEKEEFDFIEDNPKLMEALRVLYNEGYNYFSEDDIEYSGMYITTFINKKWAKIEPWTPVLVSNDQDKPLDEWRHAYLLYYNNMSYDTPFVVSHEGKWTHQIRHEYRFCRLVTEEEVTEFEGSII